MTIEFDSITSTEKPSVNPRQRIAAGMGAIMLIAVAGGVGFGIGRSVDGSDRALSPGTASESGVGSAEEPDIEVPVTEADVSASTIAVAEDAPADSRLAADSASEEQYAAESSGGPGFSVFGDQALELLYDRTTADGLIMRVHLGQTWDNGGYYSDEPGNEWQPPAWCYESGQVRIAFGGSNVIDVGSAPWYTEPYEGRSVSWLTLGRPDGDPHRVLFGQVPDGTTLVTATFGDGSVDSAAPENGVVALVVPGAPETIEHDEDGYTWLEESPDFEITFESADGATAVASNTVGTWNDPDFVASCSLPPPELPEDGEQPADPAADEVTITELMSSIYGESDESFETLDWIDDPTGVAEAREEVAAGSFEESAASAEAIVEALVFTAPNEAWFRYRIETSVTTLRDRFGIARLIGGVWKITRDTICQDLSMASGNCEPGYEAIFPDQG
ncbi:MAG: hypothetical protein ACI8RE_002735 [Ilumatobacter sp.]|jgi:hypothetical protein